MVMLSFVIYFIFFFFQIWYMAFLILHSYMLLVDFEPSRVTPIEIVCHIWILAFLMDDVHTVSTDMT